MQTPDADAPPQQGPPSLSSAAPSTNTIIAAHDVLSLVMPHLTFNDRVAVSRVSNKWREIAVQQHHLWRTVDAGKSNLKGWDGLCNWVGVCNVGALKASVGFFPGFYKTIGVKKKSYQGDVVNGPKLLALFLSAAQCTSLTSLHLCIDNSKASRYGALDFLEFENGIYSITGGMDDSSCSGIVEFPTTLRQLKFQFDRQGYEPYRLIPNIAQLTALTALSCRIDSYWAENLPDVFPASLKRLEMYTISGLPIIPRHITSITRLESLQITDTSFSIFSDKAPDLSLLDVQEGKEEHDEWCRHLTYLGFSQAFFQKLPRKLPPELVTLDLIYRQAHLRPNYTPEAFLTSHTAVQNLRQLRRLTYRPFISSAMSHVEQLNHLFTLKGLEVLDLRGYDSLVLPLEISALHNLKHLAINMQILHSYMGFFSVLTRLESLKLLSYDIAFDYDDAQLQTVLVSDPKDFVDAPVLDALHSCPNLKAVFTDSHRLRFIWSVPTTEAYEVGYRDHITLKWEFSIKENPLATAVALGAVQLLPEEEWDSAAGYGRQWTPWDQVE